MTRPPEISVIMPTAGRIEFLSEAIQSVKSQTVRVSQILLVEDALEDDCSERITEITTQFPAVKSLRTDAQHGVSAARNVGIEKATGEYVVFLDDDDILHPEMIERALAVFSQTPEIDVVVCLYQIFFTPHGVGDYPWFFPFNFKLADQHPLNLVDTTNIPPKQMIESTPTSAFLRYLIPTNSCVVRRSAIGDTRFAEDLVQGEDTYFWLCLAKKGCNFHLSEKLSAFVRRHGKNTTRSKIDYIKDIPKCYHKIESSGMLTERRDKFLVKLKIFYFTWKTDRLASIGRFLGLCPYPVELIQEFVSFFKDTVRDRRRLMKYYFLE